MGKGRILLISLGLLWLSGIAGCAAPEKKPPREARTKADSLMKMGDAYLREGRYRTAMQNYMEADQMDPRNPELKFRIGQVYADYYRRLDDAILYYQEAIHLRDDYSEAYNNLGTVYLRRGELDQAIAMFEKALENLFYRTPERAYYNLARAYQQKGEREKAIEYYRTAIELRPRIVEPYIQLGLLYQSHGEHAQALNTFRQARLVLEEAKIQQDKVSETEWRAYRGTLAGLRYHEGLSFAGLGRYSEARAAYQRAGEMAIDEALRLRVQQALQSLPPP